MNAFKMFMVIILGNVESHSCEMNFKFLYYFKIDKEDLLR